MPNVVVLRAAALPAPVLYPNQRVLLLWHVQAYGHGPKGRYVMARVRTDVEVAKPLRTLVRVPSGAVDVGVVTVDTYGVFSHPSTWGPAYIVPPDEHNPESCKFSLSDWPIITFPETTSEPLTPTGPSTANARALHPELAATPQRPGEARH